MTEQQCRIDAITRFLQGEPASVICQALGRSRRWFYKWLKRYDPGNVGWAYSRSRAPNKISHKTPRAIAEAVCAVRQRLLKTKYAQKGAFAIQWQLKELGIHPLPEI